MPCRGHTHLGRWQSCDQEPGSGLRRHAPSPRLSQICLGPVNQSSHKSEEQGAGEFEKTQRTSRYDRLSRCSGAQVPQRREERSKSPSGGRSAPSSESHQLGGCCPPPLQPASPGPLVPQAALITASYSRHIQTPTPSTFPN